MPLQITQNHCEAYRISIQQMCQSVSIQHSLSDRLRFTQHIFSSKQACLRFSFFVYRSLIHIFY